MAPIRLRMDARSTVRPKDAHALELLLKLEPVAAQELRQREPSDLVLAGEPVGILWGFYNSLEREDEE